MKTSCRPHKSLTIVTIAIRIQAKQQGEIANIPLAHVTQNGVARRSLLKEMDAKYGTAEKGKRKVKKGRERGTTLKDRRKTRVKINGENRR